jgi:hypothetical protein
VSQWQYQSYLRLGIGHGYYGDGTCRDWRVAPSAETVALLQGHRLQWKSQATGIDHGLVYGETNGSDFLFPLAEGTVLVFFLYLLRPQFMGITDPAQCPGEQAIWFENVAGSGDLRLVTGNIGPGTAVVYAEAKRVGAQGIVCLKHGAGDSLAGRSFKCKFTPKQVRWTYFVVLKGYREEDVFAVVDKVNGSIFEDITAAVETQPQSYARAAAYREGLLASSAGTQVRVFRSVDALAWQSGARRGLELQQVNLEDTDTLVQHLPAPSTDEFMVVTVTRESVWDLQPTGETTVKS